MTGAMGGSTTLLVVTACVTTAAFDFDHAFRKISSSTGDAGEVDSVDTLLRRIGLAMGEEGGEEGEEGETLAHDSLFRRLGEPEDQEAVESQVVSSGFYKMLEDLVWLKAGRPGMGAGQKSYTLLATCYINHTEAVGSVLV